MQSHQVPDLLYHLDGFITASPSTSPQCARNLSTAEEACHQLGLPLHPGKGVGLAPVLTILGIELDSLNQEARLSTEKLQALQYLISSWLHPVHDVTDGSLNLLSAIFIMQRKWYGLAGHFYIV